MVKNPKIGMRFFIVADFWEVLCPIPVTLIAENGGVFVGRWQIDEEYSDEYKGLTPNELYATELEAVEEIKAQRRIEECKKRYI